MGESSSIHPSSSMNHHEIDLNLAKTNNDNCNSINQNDDNSLLTDKENIVSTTDDNSHDDFILPEERSLLGELTQIRLYNPKKVTLGHLNINSIPNKFDGIMDVVATKLDIFLISETKIDGSFPDAQFCYGGYTNPYRRDRSFGAGGLLMYVNENIPSRILNEHILPNDTEIMCVEVNLRKQKWVIIGIYRPPNMNINYFLSH